MSWETTEGKEGLFCLWVQSFQSIMVGRRRQRRAAQITEARKQRENRLPRLSPRSPCTPAVLQARGDARIQRAASAFSGEAFRVTSRVVLCNFLRAPHFNQVDELTHCKSLSSCLQHTSL